MNGLLSYTYGLCCSHDCTWRLWRLWGWIPASATCTSTVPGVPGSHWISWKSSARCWRTDWC